MSENYTEDEDFSTEQSEESAQEQANKDRKWVRDLEKRAKEASAAKAEADAAKRELAFLKAGIDVSTPQGKLFAKAYDGDFTVEAVAAAAEEYGVIEAKSPEVPAEELAAIERMGRAGSVASTAPALDAFEAINQADSPDQIIAILKKQGIAIDSEQPGMWKSLV